METAGVMPAPVQIRTTIDVEFSDGQAGAGQETRDWPQRGACTFGGSLFVVEAATYVGAVVGRGLCLRMYIHVKLDAVRYGV